MKIAEALKYGLVHYYFIMESFIYQREELSSVHGIAGYLLLMISKNSSIVRSFKHHYCTTFCFCDNSYFSLSLSWVAKEHRRTILTNIGLQKTHPRLCHLLLIEWSISVFSRTEYFLDLDRKPYTSFSPVLLLHHTYSEARIRKN